jgi:ferredoxin-type protein NapH
MAKPRPRRQRTRTAILLAIWILFPLSIFYFSPYLIVVSAAQGIVNGSLLVFALMLVGATVFGRAYCGWLCPGAALQDAAISTNPAAPPRWLGRVKWLIWGLWLTLIVAMAVRAGGYSRIDPLYGIEGGLSINEPTWYIIFIAVNGLTLGLAVFAGRRGFCHSVCWMAPFMIVGRWLGNLLRLPGMRLHAEPAKCTGCEVCTRNCPMSLDVQQLVRAGSLEHSDCILCGTCVDSCRPRAIRFSFAPPQAPEQSSSHAGGLKAPATDHKAR